MSLQQTGVCVCTCVCVWTLLSSNADVMRDLFTQHVLAVFVNRAAKAWSPHALIQAVCVCPHVQLCWKSKKKKRVNYWMRTEQNNDGVSVKLCPPSLRRRGGFTRAFANRYVEVIKVISGNGNPFRIDCGICWLRRGAIWRLSTVWEWSLGRALKWMGAVLAQELELMWRRASQRNPA